MESPIQKNASAASQKKTRISVVLLLYNSSISTIRLCLYWLLIRWNLLKQITPAAMAIIRTITPTTMPAIVPPDILAPLVALTFGVRPFLVPLVIDVGVALGEGVVTLVAGADVFSLVDGGGVVPAVLDTCELGLLEGDAGVVTLLAGADVFSWVDDGGVVPAWLDTCELGLLEGDPGVVSLVAGADVFSLVGGAGVIPPVLDTCGLGLLEGDTVVVTLVDDEAAGGVILFVEVEGAITMVDGEGLAAFVLAEVELVLFMVVVGVVASLVSEGLGVSVVGADGMLL